MRIALDVLTGFIAFQHATFLVLEMFLWTKPIGRKIFKRTEEQAEQSKVLAQNQGLYNGFLAAGLVWALVVREAPHCVKIICLLVHFNLIINEFFRQ